MGLIKGRLYYNKDESVIYRIVYLADDGNRAYVVNCYTRECFFISENELNDFDEISEQHMIFKTVGSIRNIDSFSLVEKKIVQDRYNMISSILLVAHNDFLRHKRVSNISKIYGISERRLEKLLYTYLAFGRIESLLPNRKATSFAMKPRLREIEYTGEELPGFALLTKIKLVHGYSLYLLIDSYSKYIYSYGLSKNERDYNAIKSLLIKCNSNNGCIPSKINTIINTETWCSFYRNIQCLGVDVQFSHHKMSMFSYLNILIQKINKCIRTTANEDNIKSFVKNEVNLYNGDELISDVSPRCTHRDAKPIFKDSFISVRNHQLLQLLTNPYKCFFLK